MVVIRDKEEVLLNFRLLLKVAWRAWVGGITFLKSCELNISPRAALSQRSRWEDEVSMLMRAERGQKGEQVLKNRFCF